MRPYRVKMGTVLFREGDKDANFMIFILQGEAVVESSASGHGESMVLKVLGEGDVIGELGIIDSRARSATVTAVSEMALATMDQAAFAQMVREAPALACSFLGSMLHSVSNRLRESNRRVHTMAQINRSLQAELEAYKDHEDPAHAAATAARPWRHSRPRASTASQLAETRLPLHVTARDAADTHVPGAVPDVNVDMHSRLDLDARPSVQGIPRPRFSSTYSLKD